TFLRCREIVIRIMQINVDCKPARSEIASRTVDSQLPSRLSLSEMLAKRVRIEKHLAALVTKRNGNGPCFIISLASRVTTPHVCAVDEIGHYPIGQFWRPFMPLTSDPLEIIHRLFTISAY